MPAARFDLGTEVAATLMFGGLPEIIISSIWCSSLPMDVRTEYGFSTNVSVAKIESFW